MYFDLITLSDILFYVSSFIMLYFACLLIVIYFKYLYDIHNHSIDKATTLPFVSVVVPLYNDEDSIIYCLSSILTSNYPKEKLEVIVVDDSSKDRSLQNARLFEDFGVKVISLKKNSGAAHAKNIGIKNSRGDIIITIDSDSIMDENAILNFIPYFKDEKVGAVSGTIRTQKPKNFVEYMQHFEYDIILFTRKVFEKIESIPVTPGGMSAFRKESVLSVGCFDEKSLTEDQEIAFRLQKHNYLIRASLESVSYTKVPSSWKDWFKQRIRWIRGGIYNRIVHRSLLNLNYGDFVFMGFIYDFMFLIPILTSLFAILIRMSAQLPYLLVFKISLIDSMLISLNFIFFMNFFLLFFYLAFSYYMLSFLRGRSGSEEISPKEFLYFIIYIFLYPSLFSLVWIFVLYKEFKREGYIWGTR